MMLLVSLKVALFLLLVVSFSFLVTINLKRWLEQSHAEASVRGDMSEEEWKRKREDLKRFKSITDYIRTDKQ